MEIGIEKTKYIGFAVGTIGILALVFLLPEEGAARISELGPGNEGEGVSITGTVKELSIREGNAFFRLENNGSINAVYFRPETKQLLLLRNGALVVARGKVSMYKNELQIIVEDVGSLD